VIGKKTRRNRINNKIINKVGLFVFSIMFFCMSKYSSMVFLTNGIDGVLAGALVGALAQALLSEKGK
jgi:hypothetical protein